jgi:hypothetical protein
MSIFLYRAKYPRPKNSIRPTYHFRIVPSGLHEAHRALNLPLDRPLTPRGHESCHDLINRSRLKIMGGLAGNQGNPHVSRGWDGYRGNKYPP